MTGGGEPLPLSSSPRRRRRRLVSATAATLAATMVVSVSAVPSWAEQDPAPAPAQTSAPPTPEGGQPVVDKTVEAAKKKARQSGKRVEIPERGTETMTLYANPDGKTLR